jgi:gliding motility-associated-like protein
VSGLPALSSAVNAEVCAGASYLYNGVEIPAGQTQSFTFTALAGCDSTVTVNVSALAISSSAAFFGVCPGENYLYQGQPLSAGTVQAFTLTNAAGCDSVVTVTVFEKASSKEQREVSVCAGQQYEFNGELLSVGASKEYHYNNAAGCDSSILLTVKSFPELALAVVAEASCPNTPSGVVQVNVQQSATQAVGFSLNGIDFQNSAVFENLSPGNYSITVKDENGCLYDQVAQIASSPPLELELPTQVLIPCDSNAVTLLPVLGGDTTGLQLNWSNGSHSNSISASVPGTVSLQASNHCGETLYREAEIALADAEGDPLRIYVPNVFAPESGNPDNHQFRAFLGSNFQLLEYRLEVYDRWGNMLFETEALEQGWTGIFREKEMSPGVYVWQLWVKVGFCGREMELYKKGDVTVIR